VAWAVGLVVALFHAGGAACAEPRAPDTFVPVFSIAKSENRNQVQYGLRVDARCAPAGPAPVSAYWRMLEKGPAQTAPLLSREVSAYGLARQEVRPLDIVTSRGPDGTCRALATTSIAGAPAHLVNVYVRLKWDGVDYLLLQGWSIDGTRVVREKITNAT
jgi:hypothetical protein